MTAIARERHHWALWHLVVLLALDQRNVDERNDEPEEQADEQQPQPPEGQTARWSRTAALSPGGMFDTVEERVRSFVVTYPPHWTVRRLMLWILRTSHDRFETTIDT